MDAIDRRDFLRLTGTSLGVLLTEGASTWLTGCASCRPSSVVPPHEGQDRVLADLHAHPMLDSWNKLSPLGVRNPALASGLQQMLNRTQITWRSSYEARIDMICVAHFNMFDEWITMPTDPNPAAPANTIRMMNLLEEDLQRPKNQKYALLARNADELDRIVKRPCSAATFRTAVVHALEGAHALGGDPSALDEMARRGLSMVTVAHFFHKGIGSAGNAYPFFPDAGGKYPNIGLSELGRCVVRRLEKMGLIIDISHGTVATVEDVLREVNCPVVATHSSALALGDHPYSLYDEHIQHIARNGGIIGVILMPYWLSNYSSESLAMRYGDLKDVLRTIVYVAKIAGVDKVAIGSDFAGYIPGPSDMSCLANIDRLRKLIVSEFGEPITNKIMAQNVIDFFLANWHYDPGWHTKQAATTDGCHADKNDNHTPDCCRRTGRLDRAIR
jgi:microsomal dipeptidase-like Zn-dependent dipeptidase